MGLEIITTQVLRISKSKTGNLSVRQSVPYRIVINLHKELYMPLDNSFLADIALEELFLFREREHLSGERLLSGLLSRFTQIAV